MPSTSLRGNWPVKFATIAATAAGNTAVVAAVTGKSIRVVAMFWSSDAAISVKFQSATTDITGPMPVAANGGMTAEFVDGLFETAQGEALNINLSGIANVGGAVAYIEV